MPQPIRIKRNVTSTNGPATLQAGELGYTGFNTTHNLYVGDGAGNVQNLVNPTRQVEIAGAQTITGVKTIDVASLKILGGALDNVLKTDGAGALSWGVPAAGVVSATPAQVTAGTDDTTFISPLDLRSQNGADVGTLTTVATTIVPAINELKVQIDALALENQFVGSFTASTTPTITWVAGTGTGNTLPPATGTNTGWYLICTATGTTPPTGAPLGTYNVGDWLISNGSLWTHLAFGGISSVTADMVPVNPAVAGGTDVQAALEGLETANGVQDAAIDACVLVAGDTMAGALHLFNQTPVLATEAAAKGYVDTAIANKVTGPTLVAADGNIAVYNLLTGKLIKDGGITLAGIQTAAQTYVDDANDAQDTATAAADLLRVLKAGDTMTGPLVLPAAAPTLGGHATNKTYVDAENDLQDTLIAANATAIALKADKTYVDTQDLTKVDVAGDTMTGALLLPAAMPVGATEATHKAYVDQEIAAVSAGASVLVTGPELTGTGLAGAEITFMGISIHTNAALELTGNGLSATPLNLVLIDGGVYA